MTTHYLPAVLLALLLTACGGGGGGGGATATPPVSSAPPTATPTPSNPAPPTQPASAPTLRFTPATVRANWEAGASMSVSASADVNKPSDFDGPNVYAYLVDDTGVILPTIKVTQNTALQYTFVLQTSPSLAAGQYTGNFKVSVCRDAGCAQHYPGSPMQLPYAFQVAPVKQAFNAITTAPLAVSAYGGAKVAPVAVTVNGEGRTWTVATDVAWAKPDRASGSDNGSVVVGYDTTGLAPGTYHGTLSLKASDGQVASLPLSLQVLALAFHVDQSQISFNAINGAPMNAQAIHISYEGGATGAWTAGSDVPWLGVSPTSGTAPGDATLNIGAIGLKSGVYTGKLTLSSMQGAARTLPVQLTLVPATLTLSSPTVTLGGSLGRDFAPRTVNLGLNTQGSAWPWTLGTLPGWVVATPSSGKLSQIGASVTFEARADNAPLGTSSAVVNATASVNGDTLAKPIAVTINKDRRKVLASETGVALVATPQWSRLTRTLTVSDNFGAGAAWSAASSQSWLAVRASGNQLVLTADPASLPQDAVSYATVTLSSSTAGVSAPEPIRVALWKGTAAPAAVRKLDVGYNRIIADPIRPFVYANTGGPTIDVYNVYTGAKVATTAALGAALGEMAPGPNGDYLYVTDTANRNVVKVNLASLEKAATFPLASAVDAGTHVLAIRPNGVEVVLLSNGIVLAGADGRTLSKSGPSGGTLAAPANGKKVFLQDQGYSPASLGAYNVDYSEMGGGTLFAAATGGAGWNTAGSNGTDLAASPDGTRVYGASGAPYRCSAYQASDLSLVGSLPGGDAYPNNVEVGSDGRVYCGIMGWYSEADVWVHGADGTLLKSFKFAGYARALLPRQMVVSGDGMILVGLTDDPLMAIVPVGP
jgi:sugar lactone lactonase YvrE